MHLLGRVIALAAAACGAAPATAQTYPARSIEMIVPFLTRGMTDAVAHAMQSELSKVLGQPVGIVNKGGASGTVGIIDLFRAPPDGYTIAITSNSPLTIQPHVQQVPYTLHSFRYICVAYYTPLVLIAGPRAPFQTFEEFVRFARAKAGNLVYTYPGIASQQHVAMLALLNAIGASAVGVSTSGGMDTVRALFEDAAMAMIDPRQ
jgi:tripartite-type tricarboxylate transporter receptor subunit TctC